MSGMIVGFGAAVVVSILFPKTWDRTVAVGRAAVAFVKERVG